MSLMQIILLLVLIGFIMRRSRCQRENRATTGHFCGPFKSRRHDPRRHDHWRAQARDFPRRTRAFAEDIRSEFSNERLREKGLKKQVTDLEDRIRVLERIVTDSGFQTSQDIDNL